MIYKITTSAKILLFLSISFSLTALLLAQPSILAHGFAQATPTFAVLCLLFLNKQKNPLQTLGFTRFSASWFFFALAAPFVLTGLVYSIASSSGCIAMEHSLNIFSLSAFLFPRFLILTFYLPFLWAAGEEIGWRGYLQPLLIERFGVPMGLLATGAAWTFWHFIFIFSSSYFIQCNLLTLFLFSCTVFVLTFVLGGMYILGKSIWPVITCHAAFNAAEQIWSYQFQAVNSDCQFLIGESGALTSIIWAPCALLIMKSVYKIKKKE